MILCLKFRLFLPKAHSSRFLSPSRTISFSFFFLFSSFFLSPLINSWASSCFNPLLLRVIIRPTFFFHSFFHRFPHVHHKPPPLPLLQVLPFHFFLSCSICSFFTSFFFPFFSLSPAFAPIPLYFNQTTFFLFSGFHLFRLSFFI